MNKLTSFTKKSMAVLAVGFALTGLSYWNLVGQSSPIAGNAVTVTSVTPGTTAAKLGKTEDAAHASGDTGVAALGVVTTSGVGTSATDGDYAGLTLNSLGQLRVNLPGGPAGSGPSVVRDKTANNTGTTTRTAASTVYSISCSSGDAAAIWIKFYDKATAATSSDTPLLTLVNASNSTTTANFIHGLNFANGVSIRATTQEIDNSTSGATLSPACTLTYR